MSKVSVIMPTYNRDWIIKRAIDSVLAQEFEDFELIIVDDGSEDDTQKVLSQLKDHRIIKTSTEHKGVAAARNKGLSLAKGELIAYLDSDNLWYPNFLQVMIEELSPQYVLAYSAQNTFLMAGSKKDLKIIGRRVRNFKYNPAMLMQENFIDINAVIHRKQILDSVGVFDESLKSLEDWDLFARIAIKYPFRIKHVGQVLGEYYFFLKQTAETVENTNFPEEALLEYFSLGERKSDQKRILEKTKKLSEQESEE